MVPEAVYHALPGERVHGFLGLRSEVVLQFGADVYIEVLVSDLQAEGGHIERKALELLPEEVVVPIRKHPGAVVRYTVRLHLLGREVVGDDHGDLLQAELQRGLQTGVACDDHVVPVDDDRVPEPELADALGDGIHCPIVET